LRAELEKAAGPGRVYVLGLGNTDRADDGAGVLVANALKKHFPMFSFSEHDGVEGKVLDISESKSEAAVFFVDAANLGLKPGAVKIVRRDEIKETEITTHRVAVALMASILEKAGKKVAAICIQPESIESRGEVTKRVRASIDSVTEALGALMRARDSQIP